MTKAPQPPTVPAVLIQPGQSIEQLKLKSIELQLDEPTICRKLGLRPQPAPLRALTHENFLFIGLACGAAPLNMRFACQHAIVLRGPTLMFLLRDERELPAGQLSDVWQGNPVGPAGLAGIRSNLTPGDEGSELQLWQWGEPFPTLNAVDGDQFALLHKVLQEVSAELGPIDNVEVRGKRTLQEFAIERIKRNNSPEEHTALLELPAYVTSLRSHFPFPVSTVLSLLTFYIEAVHRAVQGGSLTPAEGTARLNAALRIHKLLEEEHSESCRGKEWPLTVDAWLEEGWDR